METRILKEISYPGGGTFTVVINDLLVEDVDCIVNAANSHLAHGGGVAAVISRAAGPALDEEGYGLVRLKGPVPVGEAIITTAGRLPFKGVIHAVGPRFGEGDEERKLISALNSAFLRASERGWTSLSFPAISSGVFSVPLEICAKSYVRAAAGFFGSHAGSSLRRIRLCLRPGPMADEVVKALAEEAR